MRGQLAGWPAVDGGRQTCPAASLLATAALVVLHAPDPAPACLTFLPRLLPCPSHLQAAAVSGVLQRTLGWGVQVVMDLGSDSEGDDEDGPVVVEGVVLPPDQQ